MRVLHLELPRGLSFTLREWNARCRHALGDGWRQVDLNFDFWPWLLEDDRTGLYGRVIDLHHDHAPGAAHVIANVVTQAAKRGAGLGLTVTAAGIQFPNVVTSSFAALRAQADSGALDPYFWHLAQKYMLLSGYSVVSLGIDSLDALVMATMLGRFIRRNDPHVRVVLTRHQYENFSLVHRLAELVEDGSIFESFDALVAYEEQADLAFAGLRALWQHGDPSALVNVAVANRLYPPAPAASCSPPANLDPGYVAETGIPADRLVYFAPLARNACYYARCTFCIQNDRYLAPQAHKHGAELARAFEVIRELTAAGITAISYSDQAIHPSTLRAFARQAIATVLKISWCARTLFVPAELDESLLAELARAGCRELLFGLESTNPPTLSAMGKDLGFDLMAADSLIALCGRCGIDVVLSLMFAFPTESDADFEATTLPFVTDAASRYSHVTLITNRFAVFRDTPISRDPASFGIARVFAARGPLDGQVDHVDRYGRDSRERHPRETAYRCSEDPALTTVAYSSIGLQHRWRTGRRLGSPSITPGDSVERDIVILGCTGYVGQALAGVVDPRRVILSARGPRTAPIAAINGPYLRADLLGEHGALRDLEPREVYMMSRSTGDFAEQAAFAAATKILLQHWAKSRLTRIVFASTQLVYATPPDGEPLSSTTPVAPVAAYEYFKVELEHFFRYLAGTTSVAAELVRLPLVYGGNPTQAHRSTQLLYRWIDGLMAGARWPFVSPDDNNLGNSWVWLPDLVQVLARPAANKVVVRQPVSGNFTYRGLQDAVEPYTIVTQARSARARTMKLVRSRFFLRDEENLVPRDLLAVVTRALSIAPAPRPREPAVRLAVLS